KHCSIFHFQGSSCCLALSGNFDSLAQLQAFVNNFFKFLFESFQIRFAVFSSVLYLTRCLRFCQQFFYFLFSVPLFFAGELYYTIQEMVCQQLFSKNIKTKSHTQKGLKIRQNPVAIYAVRKQQPDYTPHSALVLTKSPSKYTRTAS
ncbi:hypothetical protein, partial [Clostridium sp. OM02-18AC]|uniref:hypothetical protein n=1 Tax=Clostridium sp. OM02-18AC TaxID=2292311 RepID=UPI001A9BD1BA